ncbi:MAG: DNA-binding protein [Rhizobiales bacterium 17-65-6]|nr:MAG: DNA-binding protein [Rhizobiales bacterium 12-68-15]OYX82825.1 MAG: DNA-binding protein [Azorhizobium sp. 35-67-5]OYX89742.1 MAG: DNA-binding protein [Azorhizobium sp. 32-67-21]OYZ98954.1 MAG: DNA-binding protein [Rhizobiales bacterium 17-65-6]
MPEARIERGHTGRLLYGRVRPNEDLVGAIADLCRDNGFAAALVRGSLGSLTEAVLETAGGRQVHVTGAAVETLSLGGEVRTEAGVLQAHLSGTVSDAEGRVFGGRFVPGRNPVCVTFEVALEEWIADAP